MSCIVYQENKKTGIKYAYESISYWDKEKQQPRSKRKYIGRVDPDTGNIIRKDDKKNTTVSIDDITDYSALRDELKKKDAIIVKLENELAESREEYKILADKVRKVRLAFAEELSDV